MLLFFAPGLVYLPMYITSVLTVAVVIVLAVTFSDR